MQLVALATFVLASTAHADPWSPAPQPGQAPAPQPGQATPPAPTAEPTPTPTPTPTPPAATPPVETPPAATPPVETPPAVTPPVVTVAPPPKPADKPFVDDYYDRKRGVGMFHQSRLVIGVLSGTVPNFTDDMAPATPGETRDVTAGSIAFEGSFLQLPSSYGHFHGIEVSTGLRSTPFDYWLQFGTSVTFFNIGRGGIGSIRVGGGFGAGFNLAHGYGYVRGRVALVVVPAKVDIEIGAVWTPSSASTHGYDEQLYRISAWYRPGKKKRAFEAFVETLRRNDDLTDQKRELDGVGGGIGVSLF